MSAGRGKKAGQHFQGIKRLAPLGTVETLSNEKGWRRTLVFPDEKPLAVDLGELSKFGRLGQVVFHGAIAYFQGKRRMTCNSAAQAIRCYLPHYLDSLIQEGALPAEPKPSDLTSALCGGFATWLTEENAAGVMFGTHTAYTCYNRVKAVFEIAHEIFPSEFHSGFVLPGNPIGYSGAQRILDLASGNSHPKQPPLTLDELRRVHEAAAKDVIAAMNEVGKTGFNKPPEGQAALLPFVVMLVLRTCANPYAAASLRRDCLESNPIEKGGWLIHFDKPRAGEGKASDYPWVDIESTDRLSPVNIIRFLLRWTEALVARAPREARNRVFLTQKRIIVLTKMSQRGGHAMLTDEVIAFDPSAARVTRKKFSERHNLARLLVPVLLRETGAVMVWERTKNVFQVQSVLNHSNSRTTVGYLLSKRVLYTAAEDIAKASADMTSAITHGKPTVADKPLGEVAHWLHLPADLTEKVVGGEYFTGLGSCRDPYESPQPNQTKGHLCSAFWACINCGKAIFAREHLPLLIARQIAVKEQTGLMHEDLWRKKYGRIDEQLAEIIVCFSEKSRDEATRKVKAGYLTNARTDIISFLKTPLTS